jgi:hypothetical protein
MFLRYRRLLWAYPRAYRNHRGAEMITTLMEMAEAGCRPSRGQALHLVLCRRWPATMLSTAAVATAAIPTYAHYRDAYQVMVYAHGSPWPYIVYSPSDEIPVATWTVVGLLLVAAATLIAARPRRTAAS